MPVRVGVGPRRVGPDCGDAVRVGVWGRLVGGVVQCGGGGVWGCGGRGVGTSGRQVGLFRTIFFYKLIFFFERFFFICMRSIFSS